MSWLLIRKLLPYFIAVAIFCGWTWASYHHGVTTTETRVTLAWQTKWDARDRADAAAKQAALEQARATEQKHAADMAAIDLKHQTEMQHAQATLNRTISDLRDGNLQLRQQLAGTGGDQHLPGAAGAAGVSDGSQASGLPEANAEFLLHVGSDADDVVRQLSACQAVVRADRGQTMAPAPAAAPGPAPEVTDAIP